MKTKSIRNSLFPTAFLLPFLLLFMNTLLFAQRIETYATGETHTVSALCLGCSIQNPQEAIDDDLFSYSSLKMGLGLLGKVDQTLQFPSTSTKKLSIKIGTDNGQLSVSLLNNATIETMNGNVSNGDLRIIDSNILKLDVSDNKMGTITFRPTKSYDRVKITLNAGLLSLNREMHIYGALQSAYITECDYVLPADPYLYYSFNGHLKDAIRGYSLISSNPQTTFRDSPICNKLIASAQFQSKEANKPIMYEKTISFWMNIIDGQPTSFVSIRAYGTTIDIAQASIKIKQYPDTDYTQTITDNLPLMTGFHHYSIKILPKFRTTSEKTLCEQNGGSQEGCSKPIGGTISIYIDGKPTSSLPFVSQPNVNTPNAKDTFGIFVGIVGIDEFLLYDEALPDEVLKKLPCAYNRPQNCLSGNTIPVSTVTKIAPTEDLFIVSPNPTSGQITLDGNISMADADIFINNSFGKEVFRSKFTSKTFDLPATLPQGIYLLTLRTKDQKEFTRKIILNR